MRQNMLYNFVCFGIYCIFFQWLTVAGVIDFYNIDNGQNFTADVLLFTQWPVFILSFILGSIHKKQDDWCTATLPYSVIYYLKVKTWINNIGNYNVIVAASADSMYYAGVLTSIWFNEIATSSIREVGGSRMVRNLLRLQYDNRNFLFSKCKRYGAPLRA